VTEGDEPGEQPGAQGERLQKVLAAAGLGSRRACEELIAEGRVTVDGQVAVLGQRVNPDEAEVEVDGVPVSVRPGLVYYLVNKPPGVVVTASDPQGRPTILDLVPAEPRVFPVGRLDADTEGLIILTNDGELAHRLMHPSFGVAKTYLATVPGPVGRQVARRLRAGVVLEDGPVAVDSFRVVQTEGRQAIVEVVLHEGRKHIVRRLLAEVGHPVSRLVRTRIGPVQLGGQRVGTLRPLTRAEIADLHRLADSAPA
jgi:23S rRNA pseudouridine2605 synthase